MKQAVIYEPKDLRVENTVIPEISDFEVLIKTKISTTCGTDVKKYQRGYPIFDNPPHPFGHEFSGEIVKIGKQVDKFQVGDRVAVHNSAPCNQCYYCKKGQHSMCENPIFNRGSYAEYVRVPKEIVEQNMFKLKDEMSYKLASLLEPFSCAVYGIDQLDIDQGDQIIINGVGPIGLMFVKLATLRGAEVIATDLSDYRLDIAKELGAKKVINVGKMNDVVSTVKSSLNDGKGADIVIEATGIISVWEQSVNMVRKGGTVLLFGGTKANSTFTMDANLLHYSQLTIKGVFHTTPKCVQSAYRLLTMGVLQEDIFIQNEYTIDEIEKAILEHAEQKVVKNCIVYD